MKTCQDCKYKIVKWDVRGLAPYCNKTGKPTTTDATCDDWEYKGLDRVIGLCDLCGTPLTKGEWLYYGFDRHNIQAFTCTSERCTRWLENGKIKVRNGI